MTTLTSAQNKPPFNYPAYSEMPSTWEQFYVYLYAGILTTDGYFWVDFYWVQNRVEVYPEILFKTEEIQTSLTNSGYWRTNLIIISSLVKYTTLTVSTVMDSDNQSVNVVIQDSSYTILESYDLRNTANENEVLTVSLDIPADPIYITVYLTKGSTLILKSVELLYSSEDVEEGVVYLGTLGVNAIRLFPDYDQGIRNSKPNNVPALKIPEKTGDIVHYMGSQVETYAFNCDIRKEDESKLRNMIGYEQTLSHNFFSETIIDEKVFVKNISIAQNIGIEPFLTVLLILEVVE